MSELIKNPCQTNLINIVGIDGAGKSTLARNLAKQLQAVDNKLQYIYCQYFPKLLLPFKLLAKITVMRNTDAFKNYDHYNKVKKNYSNRHQTVATIYALLWIIDYIFQILIKIR